MDHTQLAARIQMRVDRYQENGETNQVLCFEALSEASILLRHLREGELGTAELDALARLFWNRFAARPETGEDTVDLATAIQLVELLRPTGFSPALQADIQRHHLTAVSYMRTVDELRVQKQLLRAEYILWEKQQHTTEDLRQAVDDYRAALRYIPMTSPNYIPILANKGHVLLNLFSESRDLKLLAEAEQVRRQVFAIEGPDGPGRLEALLDLVTCLERRWEEVDDQTILSECASLGREFTISVDSKQSPNRLKHYLHGAYVFGRLTDRSGDPEILDLSTALIRRSAEQLRTDAQSHVLSPEDVSGTLPSICRQMIAICRIATTARSVKLLRDVAQIGRGLLEVARDSDAVRLSILSTLATALREGHRLTGDHELIWEAVVCARDAESACPDGHADRPKVLIVLCEALLDYFEEHQYSTNLDEALRAGFDAYDLCTPGDALFSKCAVGFSRALYVIGSRMRDPEHVSLAVGCAEDALSHIPEGDSYRWRLLIIFGAASNRLVDLGGPFQDLSRAVSLTKIALAGNESPPITNAERLTLQSNLANFLSRIADRNPSADSIEDAMHAARDVVSKLPRGVGGKQLINLGHLLQTAYTSGPPTLSRPSLLTEALSVLELATDAQDLPTELRIFAYRALAWACLETGAAERALRACEEAVRLLPPASSMLLWRRDRQHALAQAAGLAAEAAFIAVSAGKHERAVELLEETRGTLLSETMDRRRIYTALGEQDRVSAENYKSLVQKTELLDTDPDSIVYLTLDPETQDRIRDTLRLPERRVGGGTRAGRERSSDETYRSLYAAMEIERRELQDVWTGLIEQIRTLPGLADFMQPLSVEAIKQEAVDGPIVIITASRYGGLASIITTDDVISVPLPHADQAAIRFQVGRLRKAHDDLQASSMNMKRSGEQIISSVLAWLWDEVASLILEALGFFEAPESDAPWPRIWWCPVGATAPLPFHAAGHHLDSEPMKRTVMDRVVSSYTPTVKALRHARKSRHRSLSTAGSAGPLIVAVPRLPGTDEHALLGALSEAEAVSEVVPNCRILTGEAANCYAVEAALQEHEVVHFACHGVSEWDAPDSSKLILYDYETVPFTLAIAAKNHVPGAILAYLSACDTTQVASHLSDEAIHITSAFQLIGYRHVVGTLWPLDDGAAKGVAVAFYSNILSWNDEVHLEYASVALHDATRALRNYCNGNSPSLWAAHIHVGP